MMAKNSDGIPEALYKMEGSKCQGKAIDDQDWVIVDFEAMVDMDEDKLDKHPAKVVLVPGNLGV